MHRAFAISFFLALSTIAFAQKVEKKLFDFIVPDDGDFKAAIAAANTRTDMNTRFHIFIRQGDYIIPPSASSTVMGMDSVAYPDPRTDLIASNVSIVGEGLEVTSLRNTCPTNTVSGQWGKACPIEGLGKAYTLRNNGVGNYFQGFKLVNGMADATGRGEAFEDTGDRTICKDMGLWGYQDTYFSNRKGGLYYFEGGVIRGRTDYVCGVGDIVFNRVEFLHCDTKGYITAPSYSVKYGYVMLDCVVTGEKDGIDGTYTLGRPWNGTPRNYWINTTCMIKPQAIGWGVMSNNRYPIRMAEYGTRDAQGDLLDLSERKRQWLGKDGVPHQNNPILTKEEAEQITVHTVLGVDGWNPEDVCKDAPQPTNIKLSGTSLSWDNNDTMLCWAVCRNGKVWRFTTEPRISIPNDGATYSIRAVNQMGGLGKAVLVSKL